MFRAHRAPSRVVVAWRLAAPLLAVALVFPTGAAAPEAAAAGSSGSTVTVLRAKQRAAEADMRRADRQIERLQHQRQHHQRLLRHAKRKLAEAITGRRAAERKAEKVRDRMSQLRLQLAREIRVHPHPQGKQQVDKPKLRKRVREAGARAQRAARRERTAERKEDRARALKQSRLKKPTTARIAARKAERERAEDRLSSAITQMVAVAKSRAGRISTARHGGFRKPVQGSLSQVYGCTGSRTNPRRGGCRHFHDGVDIAAPRGTRVRASAEGYVAYAGFNPWDNGSRAFVVIIGHASGYETVYAHLQPTRRVRTGQKVRAGQTIGTVGVTGRTTGPHVHWEVKLGGTTVDPLRARR